MPSEDRDYDFGITIISPEGRLFQVEYARESVKKGSTAVGLKFKDGVVLIAEKKIVSKLVEAKYVEKIFRVDAAAGCAISGLVADARVLIEAARLEAQMNRIRYGETMPVNILAHEVSNLKQSYTQHGGVRPFGASLLIAGVDEKVHLIETDPSGAMVAYKAGGIGRGRDRAVEYLTEVYQEDMDEQAAVVMGIDTLRQSIEETLEARSVEVGIITRERGFRKLTEDEVETLWKAHGHKPLQRKSRHEKKDDKDEKGGKEKGDSKSDDKDNGGPSPSADVE